MPIFALYNFDESNSVVDGAPINGIQYGTYLNGATAAGGRLVLDGENDFAKIYPDPQFQMDRGTLEINFRPTDPHLTTPQTVLSRDSVGENQGSFRVEVLPNGAVQITHEAETGSILFSTGENFFSAGDNLNLTYSWDQDGAGGQLVIENQTAGTSYGADVPAALTMDMADQNQPWLVGAGQSTSDPDVLNNIGDNFLGSVEFFSISDSVDNLDPSRDGIVSGTDGKDLIDRNYIDPSDADRVDASDAIRGPDAPKDDRIDAGAGNDSVYAGLGGDSVSAGAGDDSLYGGGDRDLFVVGSQANGNGDFIDGNENGNDYGTLDLSGAGPLHIVYDQDNAENGTVHFRDEEGNDTGTLRFTNIENVIPYFTPSTLIATLRGEVPVESLQVGDKVVTRDNGIQEIRWVGERTLSGQELRQNSHLQPIFITRGALGNGLPERDMIVSPNRRLLISSDRTQLYFDEHEVLVAAKHLVGSHGIHAIEAIGVNYVYFMFDRHEIVLSNGAWTESFQPADMTLKGMGNAQRSEIFELFPELKTTQGLEDFQAARRRLKRYEARLGVK